MNWIADNTEPNSYYHDFDKFACTLRLVAGAWLVILVKPGWDTGTRIKLPGKLPTPEAQKQAHEWATQQLHEATA
jgi:hypothetical protein